MLTAIYKLVAQTTEKTSDVPISEEEKETKTGKFCHDFENL